MRQRLLAWMLALLLVLPLTVSTLGAEDYYSNPTAEAGAPVLLAGASVRMSAGAALRFDAALETLAEGATYGMLLVPVADLLAVGDHTHAALLAASGVAVHDLVDERPAKGADGSYTVSVVLECPTAALADTVFVAIPYAKMGESYAYGAFDTTNNARAATEVAKKALLDLDGKNEAPRTAPSVLATLTDKETHSFAAKTLFSPYAEGNQQYLLGYFDGEGRAALLQAAEAAFGNRPSWTYPY